MKLERKNRKGAFPMYSDEPVQNLGRGVRGEYAAIRKAVSFLS